MFSRDNKIARFYSTTEVGFVRRLPTGRISHDGLAQVKQSPGFPGRFARTSSALRWPPLNQALGRQKQ